MLKTLDSFNSLIKASTSNYTNFNQTDINSNSSIQSSDSNSNDNSTVEKF